MLQLSLSPRAGRGGGCGRGVWGAWEEECGVCGRRSVGCVGGGERNPAAPPALSRSPSCTGA
eukprot:3353952-Rhodomonas_salina.1